MTDTGIGISEEQQSRLFTSFQQAESSTTRKFGGSVPGLVISKSIVEMMGGKIWIESESGQGATFAFTVQLKRGSENDADLRSDNIWGDICIPVVDDDQDILSFFREIMPGFGLYCDTAESGEDALAMVEKNGGYHIYFFGEIFAILKKYLQK